MKTKTKATVVFYNNKQFNSIADLCRHIGIEPYSKEYRKIKRRIFDLGWTVKQAIEGRTINAMAESRRSRSSLTVDQVKSIRKIRSEQKLTYASLAEQFNTNPSTVSDICNFKTWRDLG